MKKIGFVFYCIPLILFYGCESAHEPLWKPDMVGLSTAGAKEAEIAFQLINSNRHKIPLSEFNTKSSGVTHFIAGSEKKYDWVFSFDHKTESRRILVFVLMQQSSIFWEYD